MGHVLATCDSAVHEILLAAKNLTPNSFPKWKGNRISVVS
jgi:hypothetical protein